MESVINFESSRVRVRASNLIAKGWVLDGFIAENGELDVEKDNEYAVELLFTPKKCLYRIYNDTKLYNSRIFEGGDFEDSGDRDAAIEDIKSLGEEDIISYENLNSYD